MEATLILVLFSLVLLSGCTNITENTKFSEIAGNDWNIETKDTSESGVNTEVYVFTSKTSCNLGEREVFPNAQLSIVTQEELERLRSAYPDFTVTEPLYQIFSNDELKVSFRVGSQQQCGKNKVDELKQ
ncbi:hypothetical protein IIC68_02870, partial [archaeon]|nr:hypothetical protein [archaeon]